MPGFHDFWSALGLAVLHFLWQGALIGLLTATILAAMGGSAAGRRYAVAYGALLLCCGAFVTTVGVNWIDARPVELTTFPGGHAVLTGSPGGMAQVVAAWLWSLGALFMATRFAVQCFAAQRLRSTSTFEPEPAWVRVFESLKKELGVRPGVSLLGSALAEVPMVVGWLSPVVLVPAAALTGLRPDQVRSLLAHELAHVRRHDPILNAVQAVIEIVLFFHPAVWWISKQVRVEREYCCDDSSVRLTGDPRTLAEALAAMEALRIHPPAPTTLASQGGPLMQRISRILGIHHESRTSSPGWQLPAGLVLTGLLAVTGSAYTSNVLPPDDKDEKLAQERVLEQKVRAKQVWAELQELVKAGKVTDAQAKERYQEFLKSQDRVLPSGVGLDLSKIQKELQLAVKEGRVTQEQAEERMAHLRRRMVEIEVARRPMDPEAAVRKIAEAVEAGKLTPEQGKAQLEEIKARIAAERALREEKIQQVSLRIQKAVDAGDITPAQGQERLEAFKQSLVQPQAQQRRVVDLERAAKELEAAVASGSMTREQADARLKALEKGLLQRDDAHKKAVAHEAKLEAALLKIRKAAAAGQLTEEEAKRKTIELIEESKRRAEAIEKAEADRSLERRIREKSTTGDR